MKNAIEMPKYNAHSRINASPPDVPEILDTFLVQAPRRHMQIKLGAALLHLFFHG